MLCPVCKKKADTRLYYCAQCGVYVHVKCWEEHKKAHRKQ
jgi:predicted amidophosphoribosyltransferase